MYSRNMLTGMLMLVGIFLSGCDKSGNTQDVATHNQEHLEERNSSQAEIEKYNIYVEAANRGGDFVTTLEKRRAEYSETLASGKKLTSYYIFNSYDISILQDNLNKALELSYPMPELDEPAKGMLVALAKLQPVHTELANYANSKGYLADDGKKAREMEPLLDAALEAVAVEQAKFYAGINKLDEINTQTVFDSAEKDSLGYYRAGIVLYAKQSVRLSGDFFQSSGAQEATKHFEDSLNKTAQMIDGWDKKGKAQTPALKCSVLLSDLNRFVGKGREAINTARSGGYKPDEQRQMMWKMNNPIERDAKTFGQSFDSVINGLNRTTCI
ncbi:YiiG family protein [Pseudomonas sp. Sample_16]|uniref:YiiG family protein n=1 Tax=Pseudomonas sp. Sample_16 TaxID=2448263 RepID=UPI0010329A5E|nr:YiiG family protein [Pseudomonas sp. Sample_16]